MAEKTATLHRMVLDDHICPFGVAALELLEAQGFVVDDRQLTTRDQVDAFEAEWNVSTTPQIVIDGKRIGGYDDLAALLGKADEAG